MECRICQNKEDNKEYIVKEMMFGTRALFPYMQCSKCGCLQIMEVPEDMVVHYPADYYSFSEAKPEEGFWLKQFIKKHRDAYLLFRDDLLGRLLVKVFPDALVKMIGDLGMKRDSRVMDIGCGSGHLLYRMKEAGAKEVLGVDPFISETIQYENGLTIEKKELKDIKGKWDVVMLHHSFEHLMNPKEIMEQIADRLSDQGICLIRIPTVSSKAWEVYQENWVQLDAPRHFFLHSKESMEVLAEQAGLKIENVLFDSNAFQFWGSEQYQQEIALMDDQSYIVNPKKSLFSAQQIRDWQKQSERLNREGLGDAAAFILRKKSV